MGELAVALLGGDRLADALADRAGVEVAPTTNADHLDIAQRLGNDSSLVVGLAPVPWPLEPQLHAETSATLAAYTGVVSWHALPALLDVLAQAVAPAAAAGAHVLVTAPDPGPDSAPEDLMFLGEVADGIAARVELPSRSVAWRGGTRTPTSVDALRAVVEAHGRRNVVECPVAPGTSVDRDLAAAGEEFGARVSCADLGRGTQLDLLATVVATVADHEGMA